MGQVAGLVQLFALNTGNVLLLKTILRTSGDRSTVVYERLFSAPASNSMVNSEMPGTMATMAQSFFGFSRDSDWIRGASYRGEGLFWLATGDYERAIAALSKSIEIDGTHPMARYHLGYALGMTGERDRLITEWRAANATIPLWRLADGIRREGDWDLAISFFEGLARTEPNPAGRKSAWQESFRIALELRKDPLRARQEAELALQVFPRDALFHVDVGHTYRQAGELEEAYEWFRRAIEVDPQSEYGDLAMGATLAEQGDRSPQTVATARQYLESARRKNDRNAQVYWSLAIVAFLEGDFDQSVAQGRLAATLPPVEHNKSMYRYHVASVYLATGRFDCARDEYRQALEANPNDTVALAQLTKISGPENVTTGPVGEPCRYQLTN